MSSILKPLDSICSVVECGRDKYAKGFCFKHYHPCANSVGYVYRYRLVMEEKIGRFLAPNEVVHHKDEDESNDDPSNLELITTQSAHAKIHNETRTRNEKGQYA